MAAGDQVQYWIEESLESLDVAKVLFAAGKYLEAGFFCNLACEKVLKAAFVEHTGKVPPKIHFLVPLAQLTDRYDLMTQSQQKFLARLETFQIEGRYPQYRAKIYESTSKEEFQLVLSGTEAFVLWIREILI